MAAELYARAHELHRLNQELRQAHARERQVAVALQEAMHPGVDHHTGNIAVRYLQATAPSLNAAATGTTSSTCHPTTTPAWRHDGRPARRRRHGHARSALSAAIRALPQPRPGPGSPRPVRPLPGRRDSRHRG